MKVASLLIIVVVVNIKFYCLFIVIIIYWQDIPLLELLLSF